MAALALVIVITVVVAVVVIGLHVWGAVMDGREEKAMYSRRHPPDRWSGQASSGGRSQRKP